MWQEGGGSQRKSSLSFNTYSLLGQAQVAGQRAVRNARRGWGLGWQVVCVCRRHTKERERRCRGGGGERGRREDGKFGHIRKGSQMLQKREGCGAANVERDHRLPRPPLRQSLHDAQHLGWISAHPCRGGACDAQTRRSAQSRDSAFFAPHFLRCCVFVEVIRVR